MRTPTVTNWEYRIFAFCEETQAPFMAAIQDAAPRHIYVTTDADSGLLVVYSASPLAGRAIRATSRALNCGFSQFAAGRVDLTPELWADFEAAQLLAMER